MQQKAGQEPQMQRSDGDEIFIHIQDNAHQYAQQPAEEDRVIPDPVMKEPEQEGIMTNKVQTNKTIQFDQIKLVSSTQVTGDGHTKSVRVMCPKCMKKVDTKVQRNAGKETYLASCILLLCSFGMVCVACLPCMIEDCKDVIHQCPDCQTELGKTTFHIFD